MLNKISFLIVSVAAFCSVMTLAPAAEPTVAKTTTIMTVGEMCGGCVKNITAKLKPMPCIADVSCDITKKTVTVTPAEGKTLSAKTLWEAMESIGKTPKSMTGPGGTFTAKPKA